MATQIKTNRFIKFKKPIQSGFGESTRKSMVIDSIDRDRKTNSVRLVGLGFVSKWYKKDILEKNITKK